MTWVSTGIAVGSTAVSLGSSLYGGRKAKKAAKSAAKQQARLTFTKRQEEIRQLQAEGEYNTSMGRAQTYASGLRMTGSARDYVQALDTAAMREVAFARMAAITERRAIRKGATGYGSSFYANVGDQLGSLAGALYDTHRKPLGTDTAVKPTADPSKFSYTDTPNGMRT